MERKDFIKLMALTGPLASCGFGVRDFSRMAAELPVQGKRMPVLFTSHGSPMDIPLSRDERPFWKALFELGQNLKSNYDVKAAVVVSAHWLTKGTFVNISGQQKQLYDYYGFPEEYYTVKYQANGSPAIAHEISQIVPDIKETTDWGLDHGAWPMLMHLFPEGNVPVFQVSISYNASPTYHYELGKQLKSLRDKGVLIIGSGSLIHNLQLAGKKFMANDMTPFGWEAEYDSWLKEQIDARNVTNIINYETSHKLGKLASPTPDHFVPVLYSLGLMDTKDEIKYFYDGAPIIPAFSERSFIISEKI
ncbi:MAG TPA: class III extradiol ring-cleavage dioxygenase [Bacteroidia bacterium]|nr:class III extradiol ring-cleavage dioxygenase [Bacteroidia bacterium]